MNQHKLARLTPRGRQQMVDRVADGEPVAEVARQLRLSTVTVWRWWRRYQAEGAAGLQDRSSRPQRSPRATPRWRRRQIARRRAAGRSSLEIAAELQLPVSTVVQVQRRLGWRRLPPREPPPPIRRYERRVPGALVHLDIKKLGRIGRVGHRIHGDRRQRVRGIGWEYLHVAIDDATRLAYAALLPDETAASTTAFLQAAVTWFARQGVRWRALMTDNGGGYRSRVFQAARRQLRIRHVWTRPYTPRTNGKAERFIRTTLAGWAYAAAYRTSAVRATFLPQWLRYYNQERPHTALRFQTPQQRLAAKQ
ncbi:MAG: IS481 family transposase [Gemmatimonadales bacterium]|nr:IS481 family transposase [Gemmatimonadales bacterium]